MRILLLTHTFNSLAQRLYVELVARGHQLSVEFDVNDRVTEEAVRLFDPDLIVAPFLKRAIPQSIWRNRCCIVIHPGIVGDRGPSALDWAVQQGETEWGVTAIQATGEMDAGPIWASVEFPMRTATKSSIYRNEVTEAAVQAMLATLERMRDPRFRPEPLDYERPDVRGRPRPAMKQADRAIDWLRDDSATVLAKLRAADGVPGVLDELHGEPFYLYDAHPEDTLRGEPGAIIARRDGAILRATVDGAVWIGHVKRRSESEPTLKLPATMALAESLATVPEVSLSLCDELPGRTCRELRYEEANGVGYIHFPFYNGAMSTRQCERLAQAIRFAKTRPTRVIALMGGPDFWSNGIHLGVIEASPTPADESWANIVAIDDVAREILSCDRHLTVAALQGNAGAGGVFLALAADRVFARRGVVLNPHYKGMGNLYGSEYWTYLLPKRVGAEQASAITGNRLPLSVKQAAALGLIDEAFGDDVPSFVEQVLRTAQHLAAALDFGEQLERKRATRATDESTKPLESFRAEELERMKLNFYGFDPSYHVARYHFVFKVPKSRTPLYLARHRAGAATRAAA
jgi:putative two-component system protein, hydrogenase maturation factor HypX/HoxX